MLRYLLALSLNVALAVSATAQSEAKGDWKSANDSGDSAQISPPNPSAVVAAGTRDFAEGNAEAKLAKGGPSGVFLWAHLHGIHPDRNGSSTYKLTVLVRDEGGYHYMATPRLESKVVGVLDKPERHRHSYGQFRLPPGDDADALKDAVGGGVKLIVEINATRENKGFFGDVPEQAKQLIGKYLEGQLSQIDLLKQLNIGKSPKKP